MAFSYTGNPSNVTINNAYTLAALPNDGDQAAASTVTSPFIVCADDIHFLAKQMAFIRPNVSFYSNDTSITILPYQGVSIFDGTKWFFSENASNSTLTVANLEAGGVMTTDVAYYIYLKPSGSFIISVDTPDPTYCYKNLARPNALQFRYFGSVIAKATNQFYSCAMSNFDYCFSQPMATNFSTSPYQGGFNTGGSLNYIGKPLSKSVKLIVQSRATAPTTGLPVPNSVVFYVAIVPSSFGDLFNATWPGIPVIGTNNGAGTTIQTYLTPYEISMPPGSSSTIIALLNPTGAWSESWSQVKVWWTGYKE